MTVSNYKLWPILCFSSMAKDKEKLKEEGITHVVNCSMGTKLNQIDTDQAYFEDVGIKFHGIKALDLFTFKMTPHFEPAAVFIDEAIKSDGKIDFNDFFKADGFDIRFSLL